MGLLIPSRLYACLLEFIPVEKRVVSLHLWVRKQVLTVVCAKNSSYPYLPFLDSLGQVLEGAPYWGFYCSTTGLQRSHGQWQCDLEWLDWEEKRAQTEPKWYSVI